MKMTAEIEAATRLDIFLTNLDLKISRTYAQKLIEEGKIRVNDRIATKSSLKIFPHDEVEIDLPEAEQLEVEAENIPLDILYEDEDLLVVNKARGMTVHPAVGNFHGTLVNALLYHCRDLSGINGVLRPGIVHRLDKDTSGVMLAAKNDFAHRHLAEQIQSKTAKRIYLAIVHGVFSVDSGIIEGSIGRDPADRKKMSVTSSGKNATTHFRVLERFSNFSLIECRLQTGRTHQIRVHMSSINHPVLGDSKYLPNKKKSADRSFKIDGQALHSWKIEFTHPRTLENMHFTAKIPDDMRQILTELDSKFIQSTF